MENAFQQVPKKANATLWVVLSAVIVIAAAMIIYFWQTTSSDSNTNLVTNANDGVNGKTVASQNTNQRRAIIQRVNNKTAVTVGGFTLSIPGDWYTTEIDSDSNSDILFTASNENTDGVLGITNRDSGVVMHLSTQAYSKSISSYLLEHPVNVGSLVKQAEVAVGQKSGQVREVDATAIDSMEGSYSLAYYFKQNEHILQVLFLGLSVTAINSNRPSIDAVIQSLQ